MTYAVADARRPAHLPNGARQYVETVRGVLYEDTFVGGNPFAGWELLSVSGQPMWAMTYFGRACSEPGAVFAALRGFLRAGSTEGWHRAAEHAVSGEWTYRGSYVGDFDQFTGSETLERDGVAVYDATFSGGLVDLSDAL